MLGVLVESPTALMLVVGGFGLIIGSFLNVVILRLPPLLERQWQDDAPEGNPWGLGLGGPAELVLDDVAGDFRRKREGESHRIILRGRGLEPNSLREQECLGPAVRTVVGLHRRSPASGTSRATRHARS